MIVPVIKVFVVIGLLTVAAALATPPGRLPLALRGLQKMMRKNAPGASSMTRNRTDDESAGSIDESKNRKIEKSQSATSAKSAGDRTASNRLLAFLLVLLAVLLVLF